jgi:transposase-like protein
MTIVLGPDQSLADLVVAANTSCPACGGALRRWGNARSRVVRRASENLRFQPGRVRCRRCGRTQVVLPNEVLVRRRDALTVVARAWRLFAEGAGARRVAGLIGVPMETVRGWQRRLRARARILYGPQRGTDRDRVGWALAYVEAAAHRAGWHADGEIWRFVAYRCQGRLLFNTNWP